MNFSFTPVNPAADAPLLHSWMTRDYARFWGMLNASVTDVEREYTGIAANPHHHAWLGRGEDGTPAFLAESYAPGHSTLAGTYPVEKGDLGMHLLVAPPDAPQPGFTSAVFRAVLEFLFADPAVDRIVVEPDVRNTKIAALNARFGFVPDRLIELPDKTASLSFCTRAGFAAALKGVTP
ncbi:GNAT family N-acetyltransferase [Arthrobacter sp. YD2]|uniref:GNAT family N-acetyltransferase n=1 Tax=Arthrobacter sp. YD2 TaxID=3058046 RepID=UPI0025B3EA87|nr:GNAT family N-acetyltransferase [Arthrobacter sp. YD2]MDN3905895.1 GNAT family N-acetyltransferase [Arthrobacter sp. YD2]